MTDPQKAIDAVIDSEHEISGITIYPITLARYALLELVKSPLLTGETITAASILTTLFVMASDRKNLRGYSSKNVEELEAAALDWADEINPAMLGKMFEDIQKSFRAMIDVAPEVPEDGEKKNPEL